MPQRVLIFLVASLGDAVVAVPAIRAARRHFAGARFTLLCDRHVGGRAITATALFDGAGLFDELLTYPVDPTVSRLRRTLRTLGVAWALRRRRFDAAVYLVPANRTPSQRERDRRFFRLAGIARVYGLDADVAPPIPARTSPLPMAPHEADLLLDRLRRSGIAVPPPGEGDMDLGLCAADHAALDAWHATQPDDGGRRWIGIGPGSKMPAKIWPEERYVEVVRHLVAAHDLWPVVFGGGEDVDVGRRIVEAAGRGSVAAGALGVRSAAAGLARCAFYLGNDTGTMHLAAAAATPCVALFSARTSPGTWYPYGPGHVVLRKTVTCEGCELVDCVIERKRCLTGIDVRAVIGACEAVYARTASHENRS